MIQTMQQLFDRLPWWMNPKYPMGRWDFFITDIGVRLLALIPCAIIYVCYIQIGNVEGTANQFFEFCTGAAIIPTIPLMLRRLKAILWPPAVLWGYIGLSFTLGLAGLSEQPVVAGVITIADLLLAIVLLFAPNRVDVVSENPADA